MDETIDFSFPTANLASARQLAQQLRSAIIGTGVPTEAMALHKSTGETMDLGTILQILLGSIAIVVDVAAISLAIYEIVAREKCVIRIKTPRGEIEIGPGTLTIQELKTVLSEGLRASKS